MKHYTNREGTEKSTGSRIYIYHRTGRKMELALPAASCSAAAELLGVLPGR